MSERLSGAILAGGSGKRFGGRMKPRIVIEGGEIAERLVTVLRTFFDEIIIVTGKTEEFRTYRECKIISDILPGCGPLGGIHTALETATGDAVFILAGDMPFPDRDIIGAMIAEWKRAPCEVLIPQAGNLTEPLHAIYSASLAPVLKKYLQDRKNLAVREFIRFTDYRYFEVPDTDRTKRGFTNINTPGDLDKLQT